MTEQVVTPLNGEEPEIVQVEPDLWSPFTTPLAEVIEANQIRWFVTATGKYLTSLKSKPVISGPYVHFDLADTDTYTVGSRVALHIEAIQGLGY